MVNCVRCSMLHRANVDVKPKSREPMASCLFEGVESRRMECNPGDPAFRALAGMGQPTHRLTDNLIRHYVDQRTLGSNFDCFVFHLDGCAVPALLASDQGARYCALSCFRHPFGQATYCCEGISMAEHPFVEDIECSQRD